MIIEKKYITQLTHFIFYAVYFNLIKKTAKCIGVIRLGVISHLHLLDQLVIMIDKYFLHEKT